MRSMKLLALAGLAVASVTTAALAAGLYTNGVPVAGGSQYPGTIPLTGNETVPVDTNLTQGLNPASEAVTVSQLLTAVGQPATPRNFLVNGAHNVNQQGTAAIVGGTTTITALQFAADRWFVDTNVGSGAGEAQIITASPAPPPGFTQSVKLWRNSGALLQPVCEIQEVETTRATELQGKNVVFSVLLQPLAALTSLNGAVSAYVITGTGTDQGLGTLTASPAITPAWTNIAGGTSPAATWNLGLTAVWTRQFTPAVAIPATATEVGVELCFTPATVTSGVTDGFAEVGDQLEIVTGTNSNPGPSQFENRSLADELRDSERFFWQLNEPASGAATPLMCGNVASGSQVCPFALPVQMRGTTPVVAIPTTGTFKLNISGTTPTTWTSPTAGTCSTTACTVTATTTDATIGSISGLNGGGGSGVITVKSDVVM